MTNWKCLLADWEISPLEPRRLPNVAPSQKWGRKLTLKNAVHISWHKYEAGDFMSRLGHCGSKTSVLQTFYYHLSLLQCQPNMYSMLLDCLSCIWFNVVQLFRVRLNKVLLLDFFTWFLIPDPGWSENSDTLCDLVSLLSRFLGEDSSWPPSYAS